MSHETLGILLTIGALAVSTVVWLIRLEALTKQNARDIERQDNALKTVPERLAKIETLLELLLEQKGNSRP